MIVKVKNTRPLTGNHGNEIDFDTSGLMRPEKWDCLLWDAVKVTPRLFCRVSGLGGPRDAALLPGVRPPGLDR